MIVPVAAPTRLAPAEAQAVREAIELVVAGETWVGGEAVATFERTFAEYLGLSPDREVVACASGTDALVLALSTLGLPAGASVLVAADEGGYAAGAAAQVGLRVRVMDVDRVMGVPTVATMAAAITQDVAAVVVTHLHGDAVPLADIDAWRRERGLKLVEDCAQAHGLRLDGHHVGSVGDVATFSFYPTKNLGAVGDGGALVLDARPATLARSLREYGWGERHRVTRPGGRNSRLDAVQAAVLTARLPHLDARNARRRAFWERYRALVPLHGEPGTTVAHHAVALLADREARDRLAARLDAFGVATARHYAWLITEMPGLSVSGPPAAVAADRRDRMLTLPCFPELTDDEVARVCEGLS